MKLLVNNEIIGKLLTYGLEFREIQRCSLKGFDYHFYNSFFFLEEIEKKELIEFVIIEMCPKAVYELEKYQSPIIMTKKKLQIIGECLAIEDIKGHKYWESTHDANNLFGYFIRKDFDFSNNLEEGQEAEKIFSYGVGIGESKLRLLKNADILLMIPGKVAGDVNFFSKTINCKSKEITKEYISLLNDRIFEEYGNEFVTDNLVRYELGELWLEIQSDYVEVGEDGQGRKFTQRAVATLVLHKETRLCVLEVLVPNCCIGGNKLLNYYCGNELTISINGNLFKTIDDYLKSIKIVRYGEKKSIVFAYGEISKKELVLALANEEYAMGELVGSIAKEVSTNNIAEYDTAEVYVSSTAMVQIRESIPILYEDRLFEQSIEIFFVELVMFLDAAIEELNTRVYLEQDNQLHGCDPELSQKRVEDLSFSLSKAMRFSDFNQFYFPTVRESARKVASAFNIDKLFDKYKNNKELLQELVDANVRRTNKEANRIKNKFLFLISVVSIVTALEGIISDLTTNKILALVSYSLAFAVASMVWFLYLLVDHRKRGINVRVSKKIRRNN